MVENKPKIETGGGNNVLVIIPARGGSKGLPRKNIYPFAGHPLIAYSIAAGQQSETVTRVLVSTDDEEIAAVARHYGADVPFIRPAEISQDLTLDLPVFEHCLLWLAEHENYRPDIVVQLRPTSPIRPPGLVDKAVRLLWAHPEADSVRGVVPSGQNPYKMWRINEVDGGKMEPLLLVEGIDEPYNSPRQGLPKTYWQTGHIDAIRPSAILEKHSMSGFPILPLLIDIRYAVDIDDLGSLKRAEKIVLGFDGNAGSDTEADVELEMVKPPSVSPKTQNPSMNSHRPLPKQIELIVFDFDGVMTDNRVWVDDHGKEMVAAYRSDSMGIQRLRKETGIPMIVISTEVNPVVTARCRKMNLSVVQGVEDKTVVLKAYVEEHHITLQNVVYLGNDINDMPCFPLVGSAVVVADALPEALQAADLILKNPGGHGAVRELCDMILSTHLKKKE